MSENQILDCFGVPEIAADGIAAVHMISTVVRLCFWRWHEEADGSLQRVCTGRLFITKDGLIASRPFISAALDSTTGGIITLGERERHH